MGPREARVRLFGPIPIQKWSMNLGRLTLTWTSKPDPVALELARRAAEADLLDRLTEAYVKNTPPSPTQPVTMVH